MLQILYYNLIKSLDTKVNELIVIKLKKKLNYYKS